MPESIGEDSIQSCFTGLLKQNLCKRRVDVFNTGPTRKLTIKQLPECLREFVDEAVKLCKPCDVHVVDGSEAENKMIISKLVEDKTLIKLTKMKNCYLARTDPRDVARVESKTFISTPNKADTIPTPLRGIKGTLGNWQSPEEMDEAILERFPGSMKGKMMFVVPFSMGPVGGPMSKLCLQLTDSPYVVASMRIMTRMGDEPFQLMRERNGDGVVRALHSVGNASDEKSIKSWPCDPEKTIIMHRPEDKFIVSYGSGYGGNSLLGKKCLALRIGSTIARDEGWLAEHMLIVGIKAPHRPKRYIAAAFPSACGKTNLAMMSSALPGYTVECVGDDIAWIKFNERTGMLHAINPENGFFGVAPGTSWQTNPNAMATMKENSIFTNVAETSDGGVWWEGMEPVEEGITIKDWHGHEGGERKGPAAHPNSRFACPARQCPIIDPKWEDPEGVPLSGIIFGGRRPQGVPLVYESLSWSHGVYVGASMRSEATAAAEHAGKQIMHDPFAMRPFFGYNFGHYLAHWLSMEAKGGTLPKIFHVNWFRKGEDGKFLWPGFGENIRVIDWILRRIEGDCGSFVTTPIGYVPNEGAIDVTGLDPKPNMKELLSVPVKFWKEEVAAVQKYLNEQVNKDVPPQVEAEIAKLLERLECQETAQAEDKAKK